MSAARITVRIVGFLGVGLLATACGGSSGTSTAPNVATTATVVPGAAPQLGKAEAGYLSITGVSIVRTGSTLAVHGRITNSSKTADALLQVTSQVSKPMTLSPPIELPPGKTVSLGAAATKVLLTEDARLDTGGTVDLALQFRRAGLVQLFSTFTDR
jgi:hypothetical protein